MDKGDRFFTIISVLIVGLILQLFLGFLDSRDTPAKTAVEFAKAYFNLEPSMGDYLCAEYTADEENNAVAAHIQRVADEARIGGFELNYMRSRLFAVHTEVVSLNDSEAEVRITAERKRNINPVFTIIAKLFFIGETYRVDQTLKLIKEDGEWKVCGKAFDLAV
jgi:hypothetical protein